ncbi:RNA polymerase sigma-70 factor [Flavobacteriaceae bacterium GSB9]|nr:RNA polymerase sigma-70 factor [Flavobacteriaceae bacterium GSB9]
MNEKDLIILHNLKQGNTGAFRELFDFYYVPLTTYALKYCDSFDLAEDIVQDLFVKFWDEQLYIKLESALGPYLFTAVKNNTLQILKKKSKYRFEEIEEQACSFIQEFDFDKSNLEAEKKKLHNQIEELPPKSKEVFKAIVLDNLKYKEVALQYNISVNTVKTHYSRALKQLRNSIGIIILILFS